MSETTRPITMGELDRLENLGHEIQSIGSFLTCLEISTIRGEGRQAVWNFGETLAEKGKHTLAIIEDIHARYRAEKETSARNPFNILPLKKKHKKER